MTQRLRIFLSSPGDLASAREIAADTIEKLAQDYARRIEIAPPYMWEHEAMLASGHFQDSIEPPSAFDIVVLILWSRLGTPMPERTAVREYRGIDGRTPVTGTEWEYEEALAAARAHGAPDILVFRSRKQAAIDTQDPRRREDQVRQLEALDRFWARHFADQGMYLGAYTRFASDVEFAAALENQLRKLIDKHLSEGEPAGEAAARVWTQAPFRGLEAYEFEHAPIFFGQDDAVSRAMLQLAAGAEAGAPFLLVLGASGSGKSSLVKAGIVPKLFVPRRVTGATFPRRVIFRPSDASDGEDLFDTLARRLTTGAGASEGLAELLSPGVTVRDLAAHLRGGGEPALPFRVALAALGASAREKGRMLAYESARLVLVVDQLEELFTAERISAEERRRFISLLAGLARSGLVWVVATMRKDFWHRADETPELVRLAEGPSRLELLPPTPAQLSQMIRRPAEAAGLAFEVHPSTGIALNEAIAQEVAREPGALPLLSYLLDQLYRRDVIEARGATLTFATYVRLGRLEGAIATKAEAVLAGCAPEDRRALASVLFSLVQMSASDGDIERAVSRRVPLTVFPEGSPQRRLVEALLDPDARLLVSDAETEGNPTVRLAHEALLARWARARDFVQANAEALKVRRRIEERYALWRGLGGAGEGEKINGDGGRTSVGTGFSVWRSRFGRERGLLSEIDLADGQRLLRDHRSDTDPHLVDYIERSTADEKRVGNRAFRALAVVAGVVALLAMVATGAALTARFQAAQALNAQSRLLTEAAAGRLARGDVAGAEGIILEVLGRVGTAHSDSAQAALNVFQEARAADAQIAVLSGHDGNVMSAAYSPDGRRIVTASDDKTARIWDSATGVQLAILSGHRGIVSSAAFSPDGRRIVTASGDKTVRIWDAATGAQLGVLVGHDGPVNSAAYSPDGLRIVTASDDKTARIWDAANGGRLATLSGHQAVVFSAAFSPDGRRVVTASEDKTARIWDTATGAQVGVLSGHDAAVAWAAYSPDGQRIVTASVDRTARVWGAVSGAQLAVLAGHELTVTFAAFSADGRRIVTASNDKTARIWDAISGAPLAVLSGHGAFVLSAAFSPDGRRIVTASDDKTARIWGADTQDQLAVLSGHGDIVSSAAFSPDGRRIVTGSFDSTARIWDAATGVQLAVLSGHGGFVFSAAFSPDGRRVATSDSKTVRLWDASSGAQVGVLTGHDSLVDSVAFSPDGRRIVTSSADKTARISDGASGAQLVVLSGHRDQLRSAEYSPDGRRIVTASYDKTARIWDATTGAQLAVLSGHDSIVRFAAYSPDGRRIVTASNDKTARIWDSASGAQITVLSGHEAALYSAAFSPDGRHVVTASVDKTARIWDGATGAQLAVLSGHAGPVYSVAYSPDGSRAVTASADRTARVWDARIAVGVPSQILWARAAQFDPLPDEERASLGLAPELRSANPAEAWTKFAEGVGARGPNTLGRLANREEMSAFVQPTTSRKDALLLVAFENYAMAAAQAQATGWPDEKWRHWRYRRATIARLLARDGMMQQVADAYGRVSRQ